MSNRPTFSVIVPLGGASALAPLLGRLAGLELSPGDELIVADNRPGASRAENDSPGVTLVPAHGVHTPAFARNCGARAASSNWLLFIDADTRPSPDLIAEYFAVAPAPDTGVLAGAINDVARHQTLVARHSVARGHMAQSVTTGRPERPYAQTANCAVLRSAFEAVDGFVADARTGEDADFCFRLYDAGWKLEERPGAVVEHDSRETLPAMLRQLAQHGSGAAWLNRRYPGSFPASGASQLARRLGASGRDAIHAALGGDAEAAAFALLDLAGASAFELGRLLPNRGREPRHRPGLARRAPG